MVISFSFHFTNLYLSACVCSETSLLFHTHTRAERQTPPTQTTAGTDSSSRYNTDEVTQLEKGERGCKAGCRAPVTVRLWPETNRDNQSETRVPDRWFQKVACGVKLVEKRYMVLLLVIAFIANRLPWLIVVCIMTLTLKVKVVPFKMH